MTRIDPQTRVRSKINGKLGTTCPDFMNCCSSDETPVVYDGSEGFEGTDTNQLEIIGPENAFADFKECGAGQGDECCIFLVGGPTGAECTRFSSIRFDLIFRKMNAKRNPTYAYPYCKKFAESKP